MRYVGRAERTQQGETVGRGGVRFRLEDDELLPRSAADGERLVSQFELPDDGVPQLLDLVGRDAGVLAGPQRAELGAADGQFADELQEAGILGVLAAVCWRSATARVLARSGLR